jgi:hypothetical protein
LTGLFFFGILKKFRAFLMTYLVKLNWINGTQWEAEPEVGDVYTDPVKIYWNEDDSVSEVEFSMHGTLLMMTSRYSNELGVLESNWCLGHFIKNSYAKQYVEYVLKGYAETSNLAHCPAVLYVDWDGGDAYTLGGELICKEMFTS